MLAKLLSGAGGVGRASPTFVSSSVGQTSTATATVSAPSNIQDGDLLVAVSFISVNLRVTPPAGFNMLYENSPSGNGISISTKIASSESGNYSFTASAIKDWQVIILVYRNATKVNTVGDITSVTSTTGTAASITPTYTGTLCAVFGSLYSGATITTAPSGMTQRAYQTFTSKPNQLAIYDLNNQPATATSSYSLVWSGSGGTASVQLQVTNEPTVAPEFVASASTQNSSNATALVINKPTGTAENDLMIAVMAATVTGTWTGDTGWTEVADLAATTSLRVAYKVAGSSEGSSYTFTMSASAGLSGCILTYRYATYDTIAGSFTTSANPLVLTSISPSLSQSILIAAGVRNAASITLGTPTSMTARVTDADATLPSYIVCDQTVAKGSTGTRSMSTGSSTAVSGIMLAIKPTRSL